ncbi:MAG TPA: hypothetical protein DCZ13_11925 [Porticoccaceae bacterium]|nr:hypothetical protein [Porticoccaceae bacterium]
MSKVKKATKYMINPFVSAGQEIGEEIMDTIIPTPDMPEIDEPEPMPESDEAALKRNRRRRAAMLQTGRASTFLSKDKLG